MNLAIISESPADEAALHAFCQTYLGREFPLVPHRVEVRRGWTALRKDLPAALQALRYYTPATVILVVVDSDGSELHTNAPTNRLDELREIARRCLMPKTAADRKITCLLGLAVPCIEAWWLAHKNFQIGEATWLARHSLPSLPYDKQTLKKDLYGSALDRKREVMISAARASAAHSDLLSERFPIGLKPVLAELRMLSKNED